MKVYRLICAGKLEVKMSIKDYSEIEEFPLCCGDLKKRNLRLVIVANMSTDAAVVIAAVKKSKTRRFSVYVKRAC